MQPYESPRDLYIRSFAPWASFGGGFGGDNRGFTTIRAKNVTSRITTIVRFRVAPLVVVSQTAYSDPSTHPVLGTKTGTPTSSAIVSGNTIKVRIAGANPLVKGAPDIDLKLDITAAVSTATTTYNGKLFGDAFPDAEVFVVNPNGRAKMLHIFRTTGGQETGPVQLLPGNNNRPMGTFTQPVPE